MVQRRHPCMSVDAVRSWAFPTPRSQEARVVHEEAFQQAAGEREGKTWNVQEKKKFPCLCTRQLQVHVVFGVCLDLDRTFGGLSRLLKRLGQLAQATCSFRHPTPLLARIPSRALASLGRLRRRTLDHPRPSTANTALVHTSRSRASSPWQPGILRHHSRQATSRRKAPRRRSSDSRIACS